jgi:hypothetical protein
MENLLERLNTKYFIPAMGIFIITIILHLSEHFTQTSQVYICGWDRDEAKGLLGLAYPQLVDAEWFHFSYAFEMLIGLQIFKRSFIGKAEIWWKLSIYLQIWHLFEHTLLVFQDISGINLFGSIVPVSIIQLFIPRIELHLFYNILVLIPMVVSMLIVLIKKRNHMPLYKLTLKRR